MDTNDLIRLANRIGDRFDSLPCHQEAVEAVALHLKDFWPPPLRRQILEHVEQRDGAGLSPLLIEAVVTRRELLA